LAEQKLGSFEALKKSTFSNGVIYQTYVTDQRLVGNDPEKIARMAKINAFHVSLFAYFLEKRVQKKRAANELRTLDELLGQDAKNFEMRFEAIEKAELQKSGLLATGKATLLLKLVGQEPIKLTLQTKESLAAALPVLEQGLHDRLQTDPKLRA